jgi:DNA-binding transcriptional regulator YhcF (GntR family)
MYKYINEKLIELTAEEIAQREQDAIQAEEDRITRQAKEEQEKARKESAIAKLKALGLTEEEVKSIL